MDNQALICLFVIMLIFALIVLIWSWQKRQQLIYRSELVKHQCRQFHPDMEWVDIQDLLGTIGLTVGYRQSTDSTKPEFACRFNHLHHQITLETVAMVLFWAIIAWDNTQTGDNKSSLIEAIVREFHQGNNRWRYPFVQFAELLCCYYGQDNYDLASDLLNRISLAHKLFCLDRQHQAKKQRQINQAATDAARIAALHRAFKEVTHPAIANTNQQQP
ncbi:MAG: hypothetical protein HYV76_00335 [Candidatus Vogelbacteria bacterium]|nr:hypothetical protein [Candidatus Vogelbacteria bacterium]